MKIIDKSSVAQQLVELIAAVALENFSARFNLAFGIEPEGTLHLAAKHSTTAGLTNSPFDQKLK